MEEGTVRGSSTSLLKSAGLNMSIATQIGKSAKVFIPISAWSVFYSLLRTEYLHGSSLISITARTFMTWVFEITWGLLAKVS
jgi:hypothetical protein